MIVTQLLGGLGNQLFQYSIGRFLAEKNAVRLQLDTSAFSEYRLRSYALEDFSIEADVLAPDQLRRMGVDRVPQAIAGRLMRRFFPGNSIRIVTERAFGFDPAILNLTGSCYLKGYWQSPKYFESIERILKRELRPRAPLSGENKVYADQISADPAAVAVHVRRGDYVTDRTTSQFHGVCAPEYYYNAESYLQRHLGRLSIYVFSDDPEWVLENLRFSSPTEVVRRNGPGQDYEDFRLMSMCRHHIIANSSFSWWAAWLSGDPAKIVVAPKNWFRGGGHRTDDLIPESWVRI